MTKWVFIEKGLWTLESNNDVPLVVLHFIEDIEYRFWTNRVLEFKFYSKTHDRALKATAILKKHLNAAREEMLENKLIIPDKNMPSVLGWLSDRVRNEIQESHPEIFPFSQ